MSWLNSFITEAKYFTEESQKSKLQEKANPENAEVNDVIQRWAYNKKGRMSNKDKELLDKYGLQINKNVIRGKNTISDKDFVRRSHSDFDHANYLNNKPDTHYIDVEKTTNEIKDDQYWYNDIPYERDNPHDVSKMTYREFEKLQPYLKAKVGVTNQAKYVDSAEQRVKDAQQELQRQKDKKKFIVDTAKRKHHTKQNESLLKEDIVEGSWEDIINKILNVLALHGFVLDDSVTPIGDNWSGGKHLQIIKPEFRFDDLSDEDKVYKEFLLKVRPVAHALDDLSKELSNNKIGSITYNFGVNVDGYITAGLDFRPLSRRNVKESFNHTARIKHSKKALKESSDVQHPYSTGATFIKQNDEPIEIETVEDEHDETKDFEPSFWWNNKRYYMQDFVRCHNNPWLGNIEYPEYIHAYESDQYVNPLFIELVDDDHINVYEEKNINESLTEDVNSQYVSMVLSEARRLIDDLNSLIEDLELLPEVDDFIGEEEFKCLDEARDIIYDIIQKYSSRR